MPDTVYRKDSIFIGAGKYDAFTNVVAHKLLARWWHRPYFDSIARAFVNNTENAFRGIERKNNAVREPLAYWRRCRTFVKLLSLHTLVHWSVEYVSRTPCRKKQEHGEVE